jgi:hypothetical protein
MNSKVKIVTVGLLTLTASLVALTGAEARDRSRPFEIALRFIPQDSITSSIPDMTSGLTGKPVKLVVKDGRNEDDPAVIGKSSDDDDKLWPVRATNSVETWTHDAFQRTISEWGVQVADSAPLVLSVKLTDLTIEESNKAVGSTYHAEVKLAFSLLNGRGGALFEGSAFGDATRYGKSRSDENANEVFSDALIEAASDLIGNPDLQDVWLGNRTAGKASASASAPAAASTPAMTPSALLAELVKLKKQGFDTDLLVDYVSKKRLTAPLSSDDMVKWKQAGMPPEVIKAALDRAGS